MQFAIFGNAQAHSERPGAALGEGFHEFVEFNVEAEALGYCAPSSSSTTSRAGTRSPRRCSF